ncbi:MAG: extracellular solute-binding protein [Pseudomonadota bacterium]
MSLLPGTSLEPPRLSSRPLLGGQGVRHWLAVLFVLLCCAGCRSYEEVVVFYATSLRRVLAEAAQEYQQQNPKTRIRLEPSGSLLAIRKVADLGLRADVVAVADAELIETGLVPRLASWIVEPVTNEIVLAHKDHSRATDEITTESWQLVVRRPEVRLGRVDPDQAPLGYHTLFVWQLAGGNGLADELAGRCAAEHVVPDETELLALLESRAIDYAFLYRSSAEDHHLKITELRTAENLSRRELSAHYAVASVGIRVKHGEPPATVTGRPITYGITVPTNAPNPARAADFVAFLLGDRGQRAFTRAGFHFHAPVPCRHPERLPSGLVPLVAPSPKRGPSVDGKE